MLKFTDITLYRGRKCLFERASLTVHAGQHVGITGANGTGKSSLLALIRGELEVDAGEVQIPPDWVMAHVAQETPAVEASALDYVLEGDAGVAAALSGLAEAEAASDGEAQARWHQQLEAVDGYSAPARAAALLNGLGFADGDLARPVSSFSGGWRMRLNLACALMCPSDLLLLDEPTNHLDLDAVIWLQGWLKSYPGTLLLISHDRDFLDEVVDHIVHAEAQRLTAYPGNYSRFEVVRAERLAQQQAAHERQQQEIAHARQFIARFRAKASKARQAQSRLKALERMELIAPAHVDSPFRFAFRPADKQPHPLARFEDVAVGYGARPVLEGVAFGIEPGDRIGLLGHNGAGKSTLIKALAGETPAQAGTIDVSADAVLGYFAQHQLETLHAEGSAMDHLRRQEPAIAEQEARDFLGSFGFIGDRVFEPVGPFSGGEKARLVLALIVRQRPNLLLLDEPTNHLDLDMRQALINALQAYEGALLVVSHDRHLLRSVCDAFWLVDGGRVEDFDGDLDDYRRWLGEGRGGEAASAAASGGNGLSRKDQRRQEAERRQQLKPLRDAVRQSERQVETLTSRRARVDAALADPALYEGDDTGRVTELTREKAALERELAAAEEAWLAAMDALERAEAEA
jgi:ATP-binding cassette subfamily F protein 3